MRISILGGGGFLGGRLAARLAAEGALGGRAISELTLFDVVPPEPPPRRLSGADASAAMSRRCRAGRSPPAPTWCSTSPPW